MKDLIIFDCDGVLVDSEVIGCQIDAQYITALGYPITTENFIKKYAGMSDKTMAITLKKDTNIIIPEDYLEKRFALILEAFETNLHPLMDPILSQINTLNVDYCIASGSRRERVIRSLEITNQMKYFDKNSIFTAQQVEKGKPAPDLFLFAAKQKNSIPKNCIVIEDSCPGIQAAQAANMAVIGFLGGEHAKPKEYQDSIKAFNIPIAYNTETLWVLIKENLKQRENCD